MMNVISHDSEESSSSESGRSEDAHPLDAYLLGRQTDVAASLLFRKRQEQKGEKLERLDDDDDQDEEDEEDEEQRDEFIKGLMEEKKKEEETEGDVWSDDGNAAESTDGVGTSTSSLDEVPSSKEEDQSQPIANTLQPYDQQYEEAEKIGKGEDERIGTVDGPSSSVSSEDIDDAILRENMEASQRADAVSKTALPAPIGVTVLPEGEVLAPNSVMAALLRPSRYFDEEYDEIGKRCFKCGELGHLARNCTSEISRKRPCFICAGLGHDAKDCPEALCWKCNRPGHQSRDCPYGYSGVPSWDEVGEDNSIVTNYQKHPKVKRREDSSVHPVCIRCGQSICPCATLGDRARAEGVCRTEYDSSELMRVRCYSCSRYGHTGCETVKGIPLPRISCYNCGEMGHHGFECWRGASGAVHAELRRQEALTDSSRRIVSVKRGMRGNSRSVHYPKPNKRRASTDLESRLRSPKGQKPRIGTKRHRLDGEDGNDMPRESGDGGPRKHARTEHGWIQRNRLKKHDLDARSTRGSDAVCGGRDTSSKSNGGVAAATKPSKNKKRSGKNKRDELMNSMNVKQKGLKGTRKTLKSKNAKGKKRHGKKISET